MRLDIRVDGVSYSVEKFGGDEDEETKFAVEGEARYHDAAGLRRIAAMLTEFVDERWPKRKKPPTARDVISKLGWQANRKEE